MRYMFAYSIKGFAALMGLSGVIAIIAGVSKGKTDGITIGLCLLVFAQGSFWVGHRTQKAADRRVDEKDQNRLLRLARDRGGSLSVIEAATDLRLTVDKTETMLRDLSARGTPKCESPNPASLSTTSTRSTGRTRSLTPGRLTSFRPTGENR